MTVVSAILERNPEVNFVSSVNVSGILDRALDLFRSSSSSTYNSDSEAREAFYATPTDNSNGTYSFIAKAVCAVLLDNSLDTSQPGNDCRIM